MSNRNIFSTLIVSWVAVSSLAMFVAAGPARATGDDDAPAPQGGRRNVRDDENSGHAGRRAMVLK